jgi:PIN domain nuclease of toxin-antitoxin system
LRLLVDTQLLLWAAYVPGRVPETARALIADIRNEVGFSPASVWEVVIKRALDRPDFRIDPRRLRRGLVENGYVELQITSEHVLAVDMLPPVHKDPFDRILVAQALVEGLPFVTADRRLAEYPGDVRLV